MTIDQDLLASAEIVNDTPIAYHSRREVAVVGIERRFGPDLTAGIGVLGTKANVVPEANPNPMTASAPSQHYSLIGVPAYLKLDETDNLLNPTCGYRAQLSVTPAHTVSGPTLTFVSNLGRWQYALGSRLGATSDPLRQACSRLPRWRAALSTAGRPAHLRRRGRIDRDQR